LSEGLSRGIQITINVSVRGFAAALPDMSNCRESSSGACEWWRRRLWNIQKKKIIFQSGIFFLMEVILMYSVQDELLPMPGAGSASKQEEFFYRR
jgi:hypothetical protein